MRGSVWAPGSSLGCQWVMVCGDLGSNTLRWTVVVLGGEWLPQDRRPAGWGAPGPLTSVFPSPAQGAPARFQGSQAPSGDKRPAQPPPWGTAGSGTEQRHESAKIPKPYPWPVRPWGNNLGLSGDCQVPPGPPRKNPRGPQGLPTKSRVWAPWAESV